MAEPIQPGAGVKPTSVVWLDNNVSMAAYNSVDGRPASASRWLLTDLLRAEWRFDGVVMSDAGGVGGANVLHGTATDYADATAQALHAVLDVIFQGDAGSAPLFLAAFERGLIAPAVIDSAVARVLRLKFALGLFESPFTPEAPARALADDTLAHALARTGKKLGMAALCVGVGQGIAMTIERA